MVNENQENPVKSRHPGDIHGMRSKKCGRKTFIVGFFFRNEDENFLSWDETFLDEEEKEIDVG